mgnify:CR=1 FL=1
MEIRGNVKRRKSGTGTVGKTLLSILLLLVVAVGGYVIYMQANYYRIKDRTVLAVENNQQEAVAAGTAYTVTTYNIGFGAYEPEYTFFMDTGEMKNGEKTQGERARAIDAEHVLRNTEGSADLLRALDSDFYFVQRRTWTLPEVTMWTRRQCWANAFDDYGYIYCSAFHSPYLLYPLTEPHGSVESGLVTLSRYAVTESVRRQLPVSESFITKFTDLDRCFVVNRIPVDNGRELVMINLHLSAYDEGGRIRRQQLAMLNDVMKQEYRMGNYVIAGGDFNHDIADTAEIFPTEQKLPGWVYRLTDEDLSRGLSFVIPENSREVPSCRGADIPYEKGVNYTVTVDGFIVSDNVQAASLVVDNDFAWSDHQPVRMTFVLTP